MLEKIKKMRSQAYEIWDQGLEIAKINGTDDIKYIKKKERASAILEMSEILAEENNIDLNSHYNKYGEWIY
jgi:hypothetical protein